MSEESIKPPATSNNSLNPGINYTEKDETLAKRDKNCLKQIQLKSYEIKLRLLNLDSKIALINSLLVGVNLAKYADPGIILIL